MRWALRLAQPHASLTPRYAAQAASTHRLKQAEKRAAASAAAGPRLHKFLRPKRLRELNRAVRAAAVRSLRARAHQRALQKRAAAAAAAAASGTSPAVVASRANALPLLAPAPSPKMNSQQLSQYQEDLKLYRELRAELEARGARAACSIRA